MNYQYPEKYIDLLKSLELEFDPFDELSDDQYCDLLEAVSEYLQLHGINSTGDGVNETGALCEGLLDWLVDQEEAGTLET